MIHQLKILNRYYQRVLRGEKTAEVRVNDRDFQTGDLVWLNPIQDNPDDRKLTEMADGKVVDDSLPFNPLAVRITHVLHSPELLQPGVVVLSFVTEPTAKP